MAHGTPTEEETRAALRGIVHGWQLVDTSSALPTASERMRSELEGWRSFARAFSSAGLRDERIFGGPTNESHVMNWPTIAALRDEMTQMVRNP